MPELLQLLLLLAIILLCSKLAGALSLRLGQPAVFGKILVGLLLGPSLLNILGWHIGGFQFFGTGAGQAGVGGILHALGELGVLLLMFMAGLETDLRAVLKVGRAAAFAALGGVLLPMASAFLAAAAFGYFGLHFSVYESLFIGTVLTATSVSISAQTLMELGKLHGKEGSAILGAAVIDDVVGILILSLVIAFRPAGAVPDAQPQSLLDWLMLAAQHAGLSGAGASALRVFLLLALMALFFALALLGGRYLLGPLLKRFERLPVSEALLSGVLIIGLLYAWAAQWIGGVAAITGTFICGVLLTRSQLRREIETKLHTVTYALFVPVFFVSIGLQADLRPLLAPLIAPGITSGSGTPWLWLGFSASIVLLAIAGKVLGCQLGARLGGFSAREGLRVGVGMISRGEVGIIIALVGLNAGIIDERIFSIMVLMVLVTTLVTPVWLKRVFREPAAPEPQIEAGLEA